MLGSGGILSIIHLLPLIVIFAITGLEIMISAIHRDSITMLLGRIVEEKKAILRTFSMECVADQHFFEKAL